MRSDEDQTEISGKRCQMHTMRSCDVASDSQMVVRHMIASVTEHPCSDRNSCPPPNLALIRLVKTAKRGSNKQLSVLGHQLGLCFQDTCQRKEKLYKIERGFVNLIHIFNRE